MTKALIVALLCASTFAAQADDAYPSRSVRIIVPFATGSSTDVLARVLGEKLGQSMGRQFVIDNRPGAGGVIGTALGAQAPPDGYTLTMAGSAPSGSIRQSSPS